MTVRVELTYEMTKVCGVDHFEIDDVATVGELIDQAAKRVGPEFATHARLAAVAVNGVLTNYKKGKRTTLKDGDTVSFVKASAGG